MPRWPNQLRKAMVLFSVFPVVLLELLAVQKLPDFAVSVAVVADKPAGALDTGSKDSERVDLLLVQGRRLLWGKGKVNLEKIV